MQRKTSQTWRRDYGKTIIKEQVILVGAADNNKSRQLCHRVFYKTEDLIYIDSGNSEHTGQVVCGIRSGGRTIACMYYAYGKLDKLQKLGLEEATDDFFMMYYELLDASADFVCSDYNEYYNTSRWYFSFKSMMEYYRLCRDYCNKRGVSLKANPYMREAELAVDRIMSLNHTYGYGYRLNTRINHQWASGIVLETDEYCDSSLQHRLILTPNLHAFFKFSIIVHFLRIIMILTSIPTFGFIQSLYGPLVLYILLMSVMIRLQ